MGDEPNLCSGQGGGAGGLVPEDVGLVSHDDLIAALAVGEDGHQVAHGAAGHEEAGFLAEHLGSAFLEAVDGGVFAVDVVADLGASHGLPHGLGGLGDGVAAQVDDAHEQ